MNRKIIGSLFILLFPLLGVSEIIHVPSGQATIQLAIDVATDGDTVLVEPGLYQENISYYGKNIVLTSHYIFSNDPFYIEETVIDGGQNGCVVTFETGETNAAELNGFTITNGQGGGDWYNHIGGGITCADGAQPRLTNLIVSQNSSIDPWGNGAGILCYYANPTIENVVCSQNLAYKWGAGIYCEGASPQLHNVTITENESTKFGAGMACVGFSSPVLSNVVLSENTATQGSGLYCWVSNPILENVDIIANEGFSGIYCGYSNPIFREVTISGNSGGGASFEYCAPLFENCVVEGNQNSGNGGGIRFSKSLPFLKNVTFNNNSSEETGGGIYSFESTMVLTHVLMFANSATEGGAIYNEMSHCDLINSTISDNSAGAGAAVASNKGYTSLLNSILWQNAQNEVHLKTESDTVIIAYSVVSGGAQNFSAHERSLIFWLEGNSIEDPLFRDEQTSDYRLQAESDCIDSGIQDTILYFNENKNILQCPFLVYVGAAPDKGAFEFDITSLPFTGRQRPRHYHLFQNYPNPFNASTQITFLLTREERVALTIYNSLGQVVRRIRRQSLPAGKHSLNFEAGDLCSGVYYYRLETGTIDAVRRMILIN